MVSKVRITSVREVEDTLSQDQMKKAASGDGESQQLPEYRVLVRIRIGGSVAAGMHHLQLVSPLGVSNALEFQIVDHPLAIEGTQPHQSALQSQPTSLPVVIHGRLSEPGEVDYYSFVASEGQRLSFKITRAQGFKARLALYQPKGSWLDPDRARRLLLDEQRSSDLMRVRTEGTYRVAHTGRYAVEVSSLFGQGSPDSAYELQVFADGDPLSEEKTQTPRSGWHGSSFDRRVGADWIDTLQFRATQDNKEPLSDGSGSAAGPPVPSHRQQTIRSPDDPSSRLLDLSETEPNDRAEHALPISVPSVIEGAIDSPGDIDIFRFTAEPGQRLAFEIETPAAKPPHFNPRVSVIGPGDRELFTNIHRRMSLFNNNADQQIYFKSVRPKVIYAFNAGGEYFLQVRDVTSRYAGPSYAYRLLVRPQIPHVGEVSLEKETATFDANGVESDRIDRINLVRGRAKKLTIFTSHEEGFTGDVSFFVAGLPPGVEALAAAEVNDEREPTEVTVDPELILPKRQETTIVLLAGEDAPLTRLPAAIRLQCRPIVNGKPGSTLRVRDMPLMVVTEPEPTTGDTEGI